MKAFRITIDCITMVISAAWMGAGLAADEQSLAAVGLLALVGWFCALLGELKEN